MISHYHDPSFVASVKEAIYRSCPTKPICVVGIPGSYTVVEGAAKNLCGLMFRGPIATEYEFGKAIRTAAFTEVASPKGYACDWRQL
jgi:hypothetical protein